VSLTDCATARDGEEVWPCYRDVFADQPSYEHWRDQVWDRHRARDGFRLARAWLPDGEALSGFAYGYTGRRGQWWTDLAARVLPAAAADEWLDGHFELVSIAVAPGARGRGIGRTLLRTLTDGLPHQRLLLMTTSDEDDPARRLYASEGWMVLGPGVGDGQVIMAKRATARLAAEETDTGALPAPTSPLPSD
jgi:ribosomal protein S18 acetylase RimI-like enzyme